MNNNKKNHIKMAEQKNQNEHLNVEDALTQSEAFLIKYKNAIIGGVVAVIIIVAGFIMYKNLYAEPREEKAQAALFKGQEYFEQDAYEQALNGDSIGFVGFLKVADDFSGTKAANLAKAYAGICYAQLGKYEEAVKMLEAGAFAVVVGGAITRHLEIAARFIKAVENRG